MSQTPVAPTGKIRILYVLAAAFGLEQTLRGQLQYLRSAGFEPFFICSPGAELQRFAESEGVPGEAVLIAREISPWRDLQALYRLWRVMRRLRPAITNVGAPKAGLLGGLAACLAGVRCRVYTLRGLRLETTKGVKYALLWAAEWLACRLAHRVMCVSHGLAARAIELRLICAEKVLVAGDGSSNGVDADRFAPSHEKAEQACRLRRELAIPSGAPVVGYVGRLTRDKGIAVLVDAYHRLRRRRPDLRLLLVGCFESGDPVPAQVQREIETDPRIVCTGFVSDVSPYYQLMTVLALPTYREGYPTVALEAAAACCPIVTTRVTGAADTVEDGETGLLVAAGDSEALARAIESLFDNPSWARILARRAQRRVHQQFSPGRIWKAFEGSYRELLESRANRWSLGVSKRAMDLFLSSLAVVTTSPLLLLIWAAILIVMGRPVLFAQKRTGIGGRPFVIWKFRTMTRQAPASAASEGDSITWLGRWLRCSSLDELPQLWNVLRGDMSLIGPRPLPLRYLARFSRWHQRRHDVKPGLTGWAQVEGRNSLDWDQRFERDVWYVENASLALDLEILLRSIAVVLSGAGVRPRAGETMPEFLGKMHEQV